jgi:glycogen synthase
MINLKTSSSSSKTKIKNFNIGVIIPLTAKNNSDFFFRAIEAMCEFDFHISILAEGDNQAQKKCFEYAQRFPKNFEILESVPKNRERILESSDVILCPEMPTKPILEKIQKAGIIPILPSGKSENLENYDPHSETGNVFLFETDNFWQFLKTIICASENSKFEYDWRNIQKNWRLAKIN